MKCDVGIAFERSVPADHRLAGQPQLEQSGSIRQQSGEQSGILHQPVAPETRGRARTPPETQVPAAAVHHGAAGSLLAGHRQFIL